MAADVFARATTGDHMDGSRTLPRMTAPSPHPVARAGRQDLARIIEAAGPPAFVADVMPDGDFRICATNARFCGLVGADPTGRSITDVLPEGAAAVLDDGFQRCTENGSAEEFDLTAATDDGKVHWRVYVAPVTDRGGSVARLVAIVIDLAALTGAASPGQRRAERLARLGRTTHAVMVDAVDALVAMVSAEGIVLALNARGAEMIEADPAAAAWVGEHLEALLGTDAWVQLAPLIERAALAAADGFVAMEWRERHLEVRVRSVGGAGSGPAAAAVLACDVTARHAAEAAAAEQQRRLIHCQRVASLGEMAARLAHELSQPLAAVIGYCRGAVARLDAGAFDVAEVSGAVTAAADAAEHASGILRSVASLARPGTPTQQACNVNEAVGDAVALVHRDLDRAGIRLDLDLADGLPAVSADPVEVLQVIHNLMRNSIDAVGARPARTQAPSIRLATGVADGVVQVSVEDDGPGFAADVRDTLFTPFVTTKPEGMGMGLAICRTIVEGHGGRIWAADASGGGACIKFTLPREETRLAC